MQSLSDAQLLRAYAEQRSEAAFGEIVARHSDLVYSAALRQVGSPDLARDVAQSVFTDLARKAVSLSSKQNENSSLAGWLYRSTRYAANTLLRDDRRRQARERQVMEHFNPASESSPDWDQIGPVLDDAMAGLSDDEREAVVLRFFKNQDFRAVGAALSVTDDTAQKRVSRALEKLRSILVERGVKTSSAALSTVIAINAVQAAPAGLATLLTTSSLAGAAAGGGTALTALKIMSMTKLKAGVIGAIVVAGVGTSLLLRNQARLRADNDLLRDQVTQLQTENESLSSRVAQTDARLVLSVPAPPMPAAGARTVSSDDYSTNMIARMLRGENAPTLTREQAEAYVEENHRSADSLLAAFRATGNVELLEEAMEKYPDNPQVAFSALYRKDSSPEERRRWLETFKRTAPDNSLAEFLSAADYYKAGDNDRAIEELTAALAKKELQDFSWDFIQNGEEAYRAAGYPVAEAKTITTTSLLLPHLQEMKDLSDSLVNLARAYRDAGDPASAQAALQMQTTLGRRLTAKSGNPLITQLVGLTIEGTALKSMDPTTDVGAGIKARLDEVTQKRAELFAFAKQVETIQNSVSGQDWISYIDRWKYSGEEAASKWLLEKYGRKATP